MFRLLEHAMPNSVREFVSQLKFSRRLIPNYYYDFKRYLRFSSTTNPYGTKARFQGRIIATYHVIEKGLSLKEPRTGFGVGMVNSLIDLLRTYSERYGWDDVSQVALNTLFSYYKFNLDQGYENLELYSHLIQLKDKSEEAKSSISGGGVRSVSRQDIQAAIDVNFRDFVNSRYSIRNFGDEDISDKTLQGAVSIALKTPSVCNRQTWKVHVFSDEEIKKKVLGYQNGNRGFGHAANKVLIVTSDLSYFLNANERNQAFVDGGLFSMSLVYALHSFGIGTCCLNWSVTSRQDLALRQEIAIPDSEVIIMMIAVGSLPEQFNVANSARRKVEEIMTFH
jgi:nitroreductase